MAAEREEKWGSVQNVATTDGSNGVEQEEREKQDDANDANDANDSGEARIQNQDREERDGDVRKMVTEEGT